MKINIYEIGKYIKSINQSTEEKQSYIGIIRGFAGVACVSSNYAIITKDLLTDSIRIDPKTLDITISDKEYLPVQIIDIMTKCPVIVVDTDEFFKKSDTSNQLIKGLRDFQKYLTKIDPIAT